MGSKKLKAVVVRGKAKPELADKGGLSELAKWGAKTYPKSFVVGLGKYGTAQTCNSNNAAGGLPTNNWESGYFETAEAIDGTTMYDTILKGAEEEKQDRYGRDTCYGCTVRCKRVVEITEGPYKVDPHYGGPEYETLATFGSYCGIDDLAAIAYANQVCNQYGMDTISCGATIAWAIACFEAGILTTEDTGGLELKFGDAAMMTKLTQMIGRSEGFGKILGLGSAAAAAEIGRGSEAYVFATKKQEIPAHMPQVKRSLGLIYAVNPFGADHQSSEHDGAYERAYKYYQKRLNTIGLDKPQEKFSLTPEKVEFALKTQHLYSMLDSVNLCQFVYGPTWQLYDPQQTADMIKHVTGWEVTIDELQQVGERRVNMLRAFNAREGFDRKDDKLPRKFFKKALKGGKTDGVILDEEEFEEALDSYYQQSGWDVKTGTPTRTKLESLELGWIADQLAL